ncbi:MAG TPA: ABC transporter permease [Bryobacteraceae bacterium]
MQQAVVQDLAHGVRILRCNPAFSIASLLSLALGIGANTAIFQILDAIRLRMLPVDSPQQLAQIYVRDMSGARGSVNGDAVLTYPIWDQIRKRQQAFSGVFAWSGGDLNLSPSGDVRMVSSLWVSGEFFPILGIKPAAGRLFTAGDDYRGCGFPGAVISYAFWQSEFGGHRSVIGRKLNLNGHAVVIVGVTASGFSGVDVGNTFQVALPLCSITPAWFNALDAGTFWWLNVMGRLKTGWSLPKAAAHLSTISSGVFAASLPSTYPRASVGNYLGMKLTAVQAATGVSGLRAQYSTPLLMLLAIASLVLLITCANLANLMLARASVRQREIAVRMSIGASRGRVIRQLMTENLCIAAFGAGLGLLVAAALSRLLISLLSADANSVHLDVHPDWRVLLFAATLAILTCILFGLMPALRAARLDPGPILKVASRGMTAGHERFSMRRLLVVSQVALSLVLVVGALLFVRSLQNLSRVPTGFRQQGILIADLSFARANPADVNAASYQRALLERVRAVPGVLSVSDATVIPIGGSSWSNKVWMEGSTQDRGIDSLLNRISSGYFQTLDMRLLAGRDFDDHDGPGSPKVAIVNEAFAREIAKSSNPIGRSFRVEATPSQPEIVFQIIGLVGNSKYRSLRENFKPIFYTPLSQDPDPMLGATLLIHSTLPPDRLMPSLRRAILQADPGAHFEFRQFRNQIEQSLRPERLMAALSSGFGALAAVLSTIGLYGVISYLVARRRNEIGIRMALGADRKAIFALVLRESCVLLGAGLAVGAVLSIAAGRFARAFLFELTPYDLATLITACLLLASVGVIAAYPPARRAAGMTPLDALREE